eukprot:3316370-Amphidinium_carterae.1
MSSHALILSTLNPQGAMSLQSGGECAKRVTVALAERVQEIYHEEPEEGFFQEAMVVNYPSPDVPFTRIVEYKHVPNQTQFVKDGKVKGSIIAREYSSGE